MIDWIDVKKELPKNDSDVYIKTHSAVDGKKHKRKAKFYDKNTIFGEETFVGNRICSFTKRNQYAGYNTRGIVERIDFWAYINNPTTKESIE